MAPDPINPEILEPDPVSLRDAKHCLRYAGLNMKKAQEAFDEDALLTAVESAESMIRELSSFVALMREGGVR